MSDNQAFHYRAPELQKLELKRNQLNVPYKEQLSHV